MNSLLSSIDAAFTKGLAGHLAARMGEREAGTRKAMGDAVAVVLAGLISKAASREAAWLFELSATKSQCVNSTFGSLTGMLGVFGDAHEVKHGENVVGTLFGEAASSLLEQLSESARIRTTSASRLLGLAGAVIPSLLGQWAGSRDLSVAEFSAELAALKRRVQAMLPIELRQLAAEPLAQRVARETAVAGNPWASESAMRMTFAAVGVGPRLYRVRLAFASFALVAAFYVGVGKFSFAGKTEKAIPFVNAHAAEEMGPMSIAPATVPDFMRLAIPAK